MLKRPRQSHEALKIMVLSDFRKFQFSAPIFGRGATPAPGTLKTPKKVDPPPLIIWPATAPIACPIISLRTREADTSEAVSFKFVGAQGKGLYLGPTCNQT